MDLENHKITGKIKMQISNFSHSVKNLNFQLNYSFGKSNSKDGKKNFL
jgi:hypothetical protein